MENPPELGKIIPDDKEAFRDAIHIAIAPIIAGEKLYPGQFVGLDATKHAFESCEPKVGIVDPFLDHIVMPNTKFWLFLFPKSITSLRHEWTHPQFDKNDLQLKAEKYLRNIAEQTDTLFEDLITALDKGDTILAEEGSYDHINEEEFAEHVKNYLGKSDITPPFRCSC